MILVQVALTREAHAVRRAGVRVVASGIGRDWAAEAVAEVLRGPERPRLVVSMGYCGGLSPRAKPLIVPTEVIDEDGGRWPCVAVGFKHEGLLLTAGRVAATPAEKQFLAGQFDAVAVDMEAAGVAAVCSEAGVPFAAVKAVTDPYDAALPPELDRIAPSGRVRLGRMLVACGRRPGLMLELWRLKKRAADADHLLAAAAVRVANSKANN